MLHACVLLFSIYIVRAVCVSERGRQFECRALPAPRCVLWRVRRAPRERYVV